uniref:Biogenesis of lysosome-related organelles complex 1 subunit 3 n=1 Tax=Lygus hesperus TaxID=30085 RepID=A0A0A9Z616_LYGHE
MANKDSFIVQGEASESDEEDYMSPVHRGEMKPDELVASIAGEDASSEDDLNITISAFASKIEETNTNSAGQNQKYNSLFHKKLQESNWKFKEGFKSFLKTTFYYGKEQINEVNLGLLTSQVEAQETLKLLRNSQAAARSIDLSLSSILSQAYVPETNVIVIT